MRKPMMAGNWKMNKNIAEAVALAKAIREAVNDEDSVDRVICPPFVALPAVAKAWPAARRRRRAEYALGRNGAYTGEVSAPMLKGLASHVILGHSERRQYFAETDEGVNKKTKAALEAGLTPIVCCGESLEQNQAGETQSFVSGQVRARWPALSRRRRSRAWSSPTSRSGRSAPAARPRPSRPTTSAAAWCAQPSPKSTGARWPRNVVRPLRRQHQ